MKVRAETVRDTGACLSPTNAFLLLQGLETLSLRMERHAANALAVARFLRDHPRVAWVAYAGLEDHPEHALAQKYLGGRPGAVFSFGLDDRRAATAGPPAGGSSTRCGCSPTSPTSATRGAWSFTPPPPRTSS